MTSSQGRSVDPAPATPGTGPDFAVDPVRAVQHALTVDRVWTVPNALSMLRLLGVPLFLWLLLGPEADGWAIVLLVLRRHGYPALQVHYLGKAATFILLYAFPLLLLAHGASAVADVARPLAWALTIWGTVLYLLAGALYVVQAIGLVRAERSPGAAGTAS